jgi:hypothetical protein
MDHHSQTGAERLRILVLCGVREGANTIRDHVDALKNHSRHKVEILWNLGELPDNVELDGFDALIIHYSLIACHDTYLAPSARRRIRVFKGIKAVFIQDEYRFINRTVDALAYLRIHLLFTLVDAEIANEVYPDSKLPGVEKITVLTGYVPETLAGARVPDFEHRPVDVGYRARRLLAWMGEHTLQKWQIAEKFAADAQRYALRVDLSCREEDRIYGDAWVRFISNCKAVLGTESGASVCDFTGEIQKQVERHVARHPDASFDVLRELYFKEEDGRLLMNVVSPRCFEAAALRTLMILYEGRHSGVLEPWKHYVPLMRDHSNMDEVVAVLRGPLRAKAIIDRAHQDLVLSGRYSYRAMAELVDRSIDEKFQASMRDQRRQASEPTARCNGETASPAHSSSLGAESRRSLRETVVVRDASAASKTSMMSFIRRVLGVGAPSLHPTALGSELKLIGELQRFFRADPNAEARLVFGHDVGVLTLAGVCPGVELNAGDVELHRKVLEMAFRRKEIRCIEWLNCDPLGLGRRPPFHAYVPFEALSRLAIQEPRVIATAVLGSEYDRPWFRRIVGVSGRVLSALAEQALTISDSDRGRLEFEVPLDASMFSSQLEFYPKHDLSCGVDGHEETYVAAVDGQAVPQRFALFLFRDYKLSQLRLRWESDANMACDFSVRIKRGRTPVWAHRVADNREATCELAIGGLWGDCLEVEIAAYRGQNRLLLRSLALLAIRDDSSTWRSRDVGVGKARPEDPRRE